MGVSFFDVIKALIQILILAYFFYKLYIITSPTPAFAVIKILSILFVSMFIMSILRLEVVKYFAQLLFTPIIIAILVIYRDEIKHGLTTVSINRTHKYKNGSHISSDNIDMIMDAAYALAEMKRGALIVLPRNMELQKVIDSGTKIDANLSSNMILTIFDHDTPFHDGAIVIRGSKIEAAACYLTLSEQTNIRKTFGTRHRAALGLSEVSDALIIVVSEETQKVSVCFNGEIMYDLTREQCVRAIKQYMMFSNEDMPSFTISDSDADPWGPK